MGSCCASQRQSVSVQDSFEGVLPDARFGRDASLPSPTAAARRCEPSTTGEYEAFLAMKAAALQQKGLIARLPASPE